MSYPNLAATAAVCRSWRAVVVMVLLAAAARAQQPQQQAEPDLSDLVIPATERPPLIPPPSGAHVIQAPQYIDGGQKGMMLTIYQHLRWPQIGGVVCVEGNVWVTFDVGTDGKVYDARVIRGLYPDFDTEAIRVVRSLGTFVPGADATTNPATISLTVPILFKIR
jgi:TonB family protein